MTITATVIKDSVNLHNGRVTTFVLKYPRYIHAEFMTHRVFSRNASSSRAIPCKTTRKEIRRDMVIPTHIGANKRGMQATSEISGIKRSLAILTWKTAGHTTLFLSAILEKLGVHKQVTNRITEPFSHITVVVTSTQWNNFFALRCHKDAQPEIQILADKMYDAYHGSTPEQLKMGDWHLPFITKLDRIIAQAYLESTGGSSYERISKLLIVSSVARCARVSYNKHDGNAPSFKDDEKLYQRLLGSSPIHASPAEHQAKAWVAKAHAGNLTGNWVQYRKTLKDENVSEFRKDDDVKTDQ